MDRHFNINRFLLILKRDVFENYKTATFGILTILSISTFILTMMAIDFESTQAIIDNFSATAFGTSFIIVALFFTGMGFRDFRNKEKTMHYLCIPASSFEKMLSMLLLSTFGLLVLFTVLFALFNILNMAIIGVLPGDFTLSLFNPFNSDLYKAMFYLLPLQAILFAGAATFKRMPLFYTALYIFVLNLIFSFLILFLGKFVFGDLINSFESMDSFQTLFGLDPYNRDSLNLISFDIFKIFALYLLAPIFWIVAWFKIKEKEA